jgi:hypothetical protein
VIVAPVADVFGGPVGLYDNAADPVEVEPLLKVN